MISDRFDWRHYHLSPFTYQLFPRDFSFGIKFETLPKIEICFAFLCADS